MRLLGASATGICEAAVFMKAMCNLAMATKTLIAQERKAYNLDSKPEVADCRFRGSSDA